MKHFEEMLVLLDSSLAKIFASIKPMQVAVMKAVLESQVTGLNCVNALTLAMNALIDKKHGTFSKEEVADLLFKSEDGDVNEELAKQSVLDMPTDEEFLDYAIQRINELSIKDIEEDDESVVIVTEEARPPRNIRDEVTPIKEFLEAKREPIISPEVDHDHVINRLADMRRNRFPAVNTPVLQLTLKSSYEQINQAFQESDGHTGPERRHGAKKPPKRAEHTLLTIAEGDLFAPPLPDTDHPMPSPPPSPASPPASPDAMVMVKKKLQTARKSTTTSPENLPTRNLAGKSKRQTARKSTTSTPRKRTKSLGSIQGIERGYDELEDTLSEIELSEDEIECLRIIKRSEKLENCVVKQELVGSSSPSSSSTATTSSTTTTANNGSDDS
jgi:hypothetical protein